MSSVLPFAFALYPLGLSGIALAWLFQAINSRRLERLVQIVASGSIVVFLFQTGTWVFTSNYLRFLMLGLFLAAVLLIYRRSCNDGFQRTASSFFQVSLSIAVAVSFLALNALVVAARYPSGDYIDLSFPLRDGTYSVLQGGSNVVANPFHTLSGNPFPIDFVKLNGFGNRANGIAPRELAEYRIFGEVLHSPCSGTLLTARDGMPDNAPGTVDLVHTEGNFLIIGCGEAEILMAHLKSGSLLVSPGQRVTEGQPIGQIGNSGNTMEPHLHIEASKGGRPISLRFGGRVLIVNDVVRIGPPNMLG